MKRPATALATSEEKMEEAGIELNIELDENNIGRYVEDTNEE